MARLSVNLNKIALLRNSRRTGVPDLAHFANLALQAGAQGLKGHSYSTVAEAVLAARTRAKKKDLIVVCGSVFVVAEV